ncbi:MAG: phosphatidylglycerophosphatase A [Acidobacteriota bacterium]|nr:phosphatidylglycerophosphatase A [Acidobacteriota bacterium]
MPNQDENAAVSAAEEKIIAKTPLDYFALAVTTCGVGYLPFAPGTYGSIVGVLIYLLFGWLENNAAVNFGANGWMPAQITAWIHVFNLIIFTLYCFLGIWAANRATILFGKKDPQKVVVDEVIGQLIVFLFIPFETHWYFVLAGFLLFRLFDIWKPYPIRSLENLPAGLGICADDILAGIYGGVGLIIIYALSLSV